MKPAALPLGPSPCSPGRAPSMPPCPPGAWRQTTAEQEGRQQEVRVKMAVQIPFEETEMSKSCSVTGPLERTLSLRKQHGKREASAEPSPPSWPPWLTTAQRWPQPNERRPHHCPRPWAQRASVPPAAVSVPTHSHPVPQPWVLPLLLTGW